jgi:protoporphyrinogen oxidase
MDGDEAITLWSNTIQTMIRKTWQHATDQLGLDGRALKAAAKANQSIGRVIASVSKGQP